MQPQITIMRQAVKIAKVIVALAQVVVAVVPIPTVQAIQTHRIAARVRK